VANTSNIYSRITELRQRYYRNINGKESLISLISESEVAEQVYNSNAIENSTLTFEETEKILLQMDLDRFISERELFEAKNLARVVTYIEKKAKEQELEIDVILNLHKMLISNIREDVAGRFRNNTEWVKVGSHIALDPKQVKSAIDTMLTEYKANSHLEITERIAIFHLTFENIHPFVDGNGRIGRVLNNYLLIREGFVPINIKFIEREKYYDAFSQFDRQGKIQIMQEIVAKSLTNSYHKRLAYLEGKKIISLKEYASLVNTSYSNVLNKASRQTIEAFLEKGIWKIGV
jgi:Fic family protein